MAKFNSKIKKNWKKALTVGLSAILVIGAVFGIVRGSNKAEETHKKITPTYAVGGINEKGVYEEREDSIYTVNAFGCQGLRITTDFESDVSYQVFFYNSEKQFLESTSVQTENYEGTPSFATYARLMIMPEDDEKISWYEVSKYANQVNIEVSKEQAKIETDSSDGTQDDNPDNIPDEPAPCKHPDVELRGTETVEKGTCKTCGVSLMDAKLLQVKDGEAAETGWYRFNYFEIANEYDYGLFGSVVFEGFDTIEYEFMEDFIDYSLYFGDSWSDSGWTYDIESYILLKQFIYGDYAYIYIDLDEEVELSVFVDEDYNWDEDLEGAPDENPTMESCTYKGVIDSLVFKTGDYYEKVVA